MNGQSVQQVHCAGTAVMDARAVLVLSLLCAWGGLLKAEENADDDHKVPDFCQDYECPKYEVTKKYDTFELRKYEATRWVTTPLKIGFFGYGMYRGFNRVNWYLNGQNSEGLKIKITRPVRIYIPAADNVSHNATISLFLPSSVANPPEPLNKNVYIENIPAQDIYVKSFGGYALKVDYDKKSTSLAEELEAQGLAFDKSHGIGAGYHDLLTFFDRQNEAWRIAL